MKLRKEISDLLTAGIINQETADRIEQYYQDKAGPPQSKLVIVFGILGSLLVGLGIILILAHNWDQFPRTTKTIFAFLPMISGQAICAYALWKQRSSTAWCEGGSTFLIMAIGACIALISQIYNLPGALSSFLLMWALLSIPIVYVMRSSVASLLYLMGITWYASEIGYWGRSMEESYLYWGLLLLVLPHYYFLYKNKRESNFFTFHNWFIPLSVITCLGTIATGIEELMFIAYMSLFGLLYLIGNLPGLRDQKIRNNGYLVSGSLGTVVLLLILSFDWIWTELRTSDFSAETWISTPEFMVAALLSLAALLLLIYQKMNDKSITIKPAALVFLLFIGIFLIGLYSPIASMLINILALALGILTIREGARHHHFGILNYGLLIVTALIFCRFFDTNINFVLRGLLFVGVGLGFFYANYRMSKEKQKVKSVE